MKYTKNYSIIFISDTVEKHTYIRANDMMDAFTYISQKLIEYGLHKSAYKLIIEEVKNGNK